MAVLRLSDGSLWVHSPVQLDDELAAALAELGEVKHIVSPNYEHTKYAQQVRSVQPSAACLKHATPAGLNKLLDHMSRNYKIAPKATLLRESTAPLLYFKDEWPAHMHICGGMQWIERYPGARSYACPGLKQKAPEVPYTLELGGGGGDPPEWLGEIQATWLDYERNPFNGKAFFNEVSIPRWAP